MPDKAFLLPLPATAFVPRIAAFAPQHWIPIVFGQLAPPCGLLTNWPEQI
ncbi:MAG: hypothetical protein JOY79_03750 [Acidobacteriaceae bacterium]|nr:hypothetical protein [Acidobacteriaceae bacterium]